MGVGVRHLRDGVRPTTVCVPVHYNRGRQITLSAFQRSIRALIHWRTYDPVVGDTPIVVAARKLVGTSEESFQSPVVHPRYTDDTGVNELIRGFLCLEPGRRLKLVDSMYLPLNRASECVHATFFVSHRQELPRGLQCSPDFCRDLVSKVVDYDMRDRDKVAACAIISELVAGGNMKQPQQQHLQDVEKILVYLGYRVLGSKKRG